MDKQISLKTKEEYVEILEILKYIDDELVKKIPPKLINVFKENSSKTYKYTYNANVSLKENNLKKGTLAILALLNLNYWCENPQHKKELINQYRKNEIKLQERLKQEYPVDNLFKNKQKQPTQNAMIKYEEKSFIKKIFEKILSWFVK